jgi:hypothetical protein
MSFENEVQERIKRQNLQIAEMKQQIQDLSQQTLNVESLAGKRVPFSYVVNIDLTQGTDQLSEGSVQTSRSGPFFAERLMCSMYIKAVQSGGDASWVGRYLPIGSRSVYPYIWPAGATGTIAVDPPLDFEFSYEADASDRQRSDKFVPGDVFDRFDDDGILPVSDIFPQGTTITFKLNPLRAVGNNTPWNHGTTGVSEFRFQATFWGYKIIQPTQV